MLAPRTQAVGDLVANGSQVFLGIERERVCHYQQQLHEYERQRRERDATLRCLRDESQSLTAAAGAMVPAAVTRLLELELLLDQAYHRHHAQTLAKQQAATRIQALREKLPLREQRVANKRQELAVVSREIEKRGQALAESSNQAQQARSSLVELQERVVRQRAARQQELAALHALLGVGALARDIQSLEQQLRDLVAEAPAHTSHRQQQKICEQLARLNDQMARKTLNRPAEFDQKTGAIVPPHQAHFDPRWTHGSPVGRTERLRCLSAGPSPNRPPTAWATASELQGAGKGGSQGGSRHAALGNVGGSARHELLVNAWHAITHATGRTTDAEMTALLLEHAEKQERLQLRKTALDTQRTSLRASLRHYKQELVDAVQCKAVLSTSLQGQCDEGHELPAGERQLQIVKQQLTDAEAQLLATSQRLSLLTALLAAVDPGLKQLMQTCGSGVNTELPDKHRHVDGDDDDETSPLSMVERRVSCVLAALESAGLVTEPGALQVQIPAQRLGQAKA